MTSWNCVRHKENQERNCPFLHSPLNFWTFPTDKCQVNGVTHLKVNLPADSASYECGHENQSQISYGLLAGGLQLHSAESILSSRTSIIKHTRVINQPTLPLNQLPSARWLRKKLQWLEFWSNLSKITSDWGHCILTTISHGTCKSSCCRGPWCRSAFLDLKGIHFFLLLNTDDILKNVGNQTVSATQWLP